ncbi:hypothetical protein HanRHA438_Chr09g0415941 [Helianthus annuus]|nr:hypothetical protein HanIR_Chr09g0435431 [Helianthus annuus]KAJ0889723.1 hypothetical protein HanRHA438_Chr09g0415941 [Helianthus annuus]
MQLIYHLFLNRNNSGLVSKQTRFLNCQSCGKAVHNLVVSIQHRCRLRYRSHRRFIPFHVVRKHRWFTGFVHVNNIRLLVLCRDITIAKHHDYCHQDHIPWLHLVKVYCVFLENIRD